MNALLDAFWRAAAYCLHPRVILGSLAPVLVSGGLVFGLGWFYWDSSVEALRTSMDQWPFAGSVFGWLDSIGAGGLRTLVAPLLIVALSVPLVVVLSLLLVALLMTPTILTLVVARRFATLERRRGAGWFQASVWSLTATVLALLVLVLSLPLWLVPPVALVLPPLIWGWLTYRVFSFEVMAEHASVAERRRVMREHRGPLFAMGVVAGYMGAAPTLVLAWAATPLAVVFAPLLIVLAVWLYTLVFAFAAAWFAHYCLAALQVLRVAEAAQVDVVDPGEMTGTPVALDPPAPALPPPNPLPPAAP